VIIDHWYVDKGALYRGEEYELSVPTGNGFTHTSARFTVGEVRVNVELVLTREHAPAPWLRLVNAKMGTGHWSEGLPLPAELFVALKLSSDPNHTVGSTRVQHAGTQSHLDVQLDTEVAVMAHERYTVELQPSLLVLRSACELVVDAGGGPASAQLLVPRAWKPVIVIELRSSDLVSLPTGLRVRFTHRQLRVQVAEAAYRVW
jgi:hypothetical protein